MDAILEQVNSMGDAFVNFALPMLVQSSVLIVVLLGLDLILRKRVKAVFRYWIWMIVLVKLVLPTTLSSPTSPAYWFGDELHSVMPEEPLAISSPTDMPIATSTLASLKSPAVSSTETTVPASSMTWQGCAFLAWLAAILIMAALLIQRAFFVRRLIAESGEASDAIMNTLERAREQMGIGKKIALRLSTSAVSPSVCGLLRPTILIPKGLPDEINPRHLKSILLHELAHIKRADLWVNSIQAIVQIIYIYNPLLWVANAIIRKVREQAVDEMVLVTMGDQAEEYPRTLVNISKLAFGSPALSLRLTGVVESRKALIGRIKHITSHPFPSSAKLGIGGLLTVIILSAALLPMARAEKSSEPNADVATEDKEVSAKSLHEATADGDLEQIKLLLAKGSGIDTRSEKGMTPLHLAAREGHKDTVEFLITRGADINVHGGGAKPVWFAMKSGHRDVVELLIQKGAKVLPMKLAACFGDTERVSKLIREGADVNAKGAGKGRTALHWAVAHGHKDTAELLIKNGANVSGRADTGWTPLHVAAQHEQKEMVELLIAHDANVTAKGKGGYTPLSPVTWGKNPVAVAIAALLIDAGADMYAETNWGESPVVEAVEYNKVELVELFIDKGMDPNRPDSGGWKPLHWAAYKGSKEVMQLLLSKGADVNCKDKDGITPIQLAINHSGSVRTEVVRLLASHGAEIPSIHLVAYLGDIEKVKALINGGADINARWSRFGTPLRTAAAGDQKDVAELLIANGADVSIKDGNGRTPLFWAVQNGRSNMVEMLLAHGADVNGRNRGGNDTALWMACAQGNFEMAEFLLAKGADIQAENDGGWTPLHVATYTGRTKVVELLLSKGAKLTPRSNINETPLHLSIKGGRKEILDVLLKHGADIHAKRKGFTPIVMAMSAGQNEMIRLLIERGAEHSPPHIDAYFGELRKVEEFLDKGGDIHLRNPGGQILLHIAICGSRTDVVKFLLDKGSNVNLQDNFGWSALHWACRKGQLQLVKDLLARGADLDIQDSTGRIPTYWAVLHNYRDITRLTLDKGADVNSKDHHRQTPLHGASYHGGIDMIGLLLSKGAEVNAKAAVNAPFDSGGRTPLHRACQQGHIEAVKLLLDKGADVNATKSNGETVLDLAKKHGHLKIIELLRKHGAKE